MCRVAAAVLACEAAEPADLYAKPAAQGRRRLVARPCYSIQPIAHNLQPIAYSP